MKRQNRSSQVKSNQGKSQIKSNQVKSKTISQVKSSNNQIKSHNKVSEKAKRPCEVKSSQIKS